VSDSHQNDTLLPTSAVLNTDQGCGVGSPVIRLRLQSISIIRLQLRLRLRADSDLQLY